MDGMPHMQEQFSAISRDGWYAANAAATHVNLKEVSAYL
jgi:hypothetical protein